MRATAWLLARKGASGGGVDHPVREVLQRAGQRSGVGSGGSTGHDQSGGQACGQPPAMRHEPPPRGRWCGRARGGDGGWVGAVPEPGQHGGLDGQFSGLSRAGQVVQYLPQRGLMRRLECG